MGRRIELVRHAWGALPALLDLRPEGRTTVADHIERWAREHGDRTFLVFDPEDDAGALRRLTWAELDSEASRVARWALARGLRRGDVVALMMENRPEYVPTWAGLAKLGVAAALINTNLSGRALAHALAAAGTDTLVIGTECLAGLASALPELERPLEVWLRHDGSASGPAPVPEGALDLDAELALHPGTPLDPSIRDELRCGDELFYIYTSGTTGLPKAARFSHLRFLGSGLGPAVLLRMGPRDVHYCALPLYHSAGGAMMVSSVIASGATLALRRRFSASAFWDDCRRFGATRFQYIGEFCRYLLGQPPGPSDRDHSVRIITGNGLRPDIWEEFQQRFGIEQIVEFYAATEGNAGFANFDGPVGSVGRPPGGWLGRQLSNARLIRYDVESDSHPRDARGFCIECGADEPGELIGRIGGRGGELVRFEGYTSPEATQRKILRDVFEKGDAWFRSGDLLRRDRAGWFYFVDRIGDTFRWKGENVSTQEVAEALSGFPGVDMVNVYGVEIEGRDGRAGMVALVHPPGASALDPAALWSHVHAKLPVYAMPAFVRLMEDADLTGTFKLRKVELQKEGFDLERIHDPIWVRDDAARSFVPLTPELRKRVLSGEHRL